MSRQRLEMAVEQIRFARHYTLGLLEDIEEGDWFAQPGDSPTHIAWQVGHLAMAQYALTVLRIRGKEPSDEAVISKAFFRTFQKGTTPGGREDYPGPPEIRATLEAVNTLAHDELAKWTDADLEESLPAPTAVYETKLGSVLFCSAHELIHAGQIGLLRRLLGKSPVR